MLGQIPAPPFARSVATEAGQGEIMLDIVPALENWQLHSDMEKRIALGAQCHRFSYYW